MLSYRHSFHAGNHADVFKHITLSLTIEAMKEKEKGFLYLDTHSGAGRYLLQSEHSAKTCEYQQGIGKLWDQPDLPELLSPYFSAIKHYNSGQRLQYYPGSPLIAKQLLRAQDRLNLTELHSSDFPLLRKEFNDDKRAQVSREDGYQQLKSKLPPLSKRGVILIDPSYEIKSDYTDMAKHISDGYKRFATGVYLLWYPVVLRSQIDKMIDNIVATGIKDIIQIELGIRPDNNQKGMTASGMIVINAPWKLMQQMETVLPWVQHKIDTDGVGFYTVKRLVNE